MQPGQLIGPYRLDTPIARGGMGEIWRARHPTLERDVAIKVIIPAASDRPALREAFLREVASLSRLHSPKTLQILDFGLTDEQIPYMVTEYLVGEDLRHRVKRTGALPVPQVVALGLDVLESLSEAHALGIVHRDLKPANVFLHRVRSVEGERDTVKVLDFGVAKIIDVSDPEGTLWPGNALKGSPRYMAPEQVRQETITPLTDLYAFGCLIHFAIVGEPVFGGERDEVLAAHLEKAPIPLCQRAPLLDIPEPLEALVSDCLAKRPSDRPASAEEVRERLKAVERLVGRRLPGFRIPTAVGLEQLSPGARVRHHEPESPRSFDPLLEVPTWEPPPRRPVEDPLLAQLELRPADLEQASRAGEALLRELQALAEPVSASEESLPESPRQAPEVLEVSPLRQSSRRMPDADAAPRPSEPKPEYPEVSPLRSAAQADVKPGELELAPLPPRPVKAPIEAPMVVRSPVTGRPVGQGVRAPLLTRKGPDRVQAAIVTAAVLLVLGVSFGARRPLARLFGATPLAPREATGWQEPTTVIADPRPDPTPEPPLIEPKAIAQPTGDAAVDAGLAPGASVLIKLANTTARFVRLDTKAVICADQADCLVPIDVDVQIDKKGFRTVRLSGDDLYDRRGGRWSLVLQPK